MGNIETALDYLSADVPRDEWVTVLMAIKSELGDAGHDLANEWSKKGHSYSPTDFKSTWRSIKPNGGINIGTLFKLAKDNGYIADSDYMPISNAEHAERQRQAEIAEQQAIEQRIQSVANYWRTLKAKHPPQPCNTHPYLSMKGIQPHGVHYLPCYTDKYTKAHGNDPLLLWVMRGNKLTGFQMIYPDGFKRFVSGTVKSGGYYMVTRFDASQTAKAGKVILCEGFATACSVLENRYPDAITYIAFDAGNMPSVGDYLRRLYPDKEIIICADNDHATEAETGRNTGILYGTQSARLASASLEYPIFEGVDAELYSDWNDYYTLKKKEGQA